MLILAAMAVMLMVVAVDIRIAGQGPCQEGADRAVRFSGYAAAELDPGLGQCHLSAAADTAANQHIHLQPRQEACQCAVAAAGGVGHLLLDDLPVLYIIDFHLAGMPEVLKHLTVFIRYCNSHVWVSSLFKPPFPSQEAADI